MAKSIHPSLDSVYELVKNNQEQTTPYLVPSYLYWEKALTKLEHASSDTYSDVSLVVMDLVYLACTVYHSFAPFIKHVSPGTSWINIIWNYIDVAGAAVVGINEGLNQDPWARFWYLVCAAQLTLGTAYTVWVVAESLNQELDQDYLITSAASSGYTFAAAMAFSSSLEYRDYKLGSARINELEKIISTLQENITPQQKSIINNISSKLQENILLPDNEIKNIHISSADEKKQLIQFARTKQFLNSEQEDNKIHARGALSWGLCAIAMTIVANTSTCIEAFNLTDKETTLLAAMTSLFSVILSSLYRNFPYVAPKNKPKGNQIIPVQPSNHQTPIEMFSQHQQTDIPAPIV